MATLTESAVCGRCRQTRRIPDQIAPMGWICRECQLEHQREYAREHYRRNRAAYLERQRRARQDPDYQELRRMDDRARAFDAGLQPHRQYGVKGAYRQSSGPWDAVPIEPFRRWLISTFDLSEISQGELAVRLNIPERRIYAVLRGEQDRIALDVVDRAFVAYGDPALLHDLYPLEEA